jgi:hypothetical protein
MATTTSAPHRPSRRDAAAAAQALLPDASV